MTDIVEIAKERQTRLAAEMDEVNEFIRIAEALLKHSQSKSSKASDIEDKKAAGGNSAETERGGLSEHKLKIAELLQSVNLSHAATHAASDA